MKPNNLGALLVAVILAACMRRPHVESLHVGMSRDQVVAQLGTPDSIVVDQGRELLMWEWDRMGDGPYGGAYVFADIRGGSLAAYGDKPVTDAEIAANAQTRASAAGLLGAAMVSNAIAAPKTINHNVSGSLWIRDW